MSTASSSRWWCPPSTDDVDRLAEQRGDLGRPQPALDEPADASCTSRSSSTSIVPRMASVTRPARALGVRGLGEPPPEPLADVDAGQPLRRAPRG